MLKVSLLCSVLVLAVGALVWAWRTSLRRVEERLMERFTETQREQQQHLHKPVIVDHHIPSPHHSKAVDMEIEAIPTDVFERECADVLSQIAHRRKQYRPTTRRRRSPIDQK